jgi:hypothetical protein
MAAYRVRGDKELLIRIRMEMSSQLHSPVCFTRSTHQIGWVGNFPALAVGRTPIVQLVTDRCRNSSQSTTRPIQWDSTSERHLQVGRPTRRLEFVGKEWRQFLSSCHVVSRNLSLHGIQEFINCLHKSKPADSSQPAESSSHSHAYSKYVSWRTQSALSEPLSFTYYDGAGY